MPTKKTTAKKTAKKIIPDVFITPDVEGCLMVAAGTNPDNPKQIEVNLIMSGQAWNLKCFDEEKAFKEWLGGNSIKVFSWQPADDITGISGMYIKPDVMNHLKLVG